MNEGVFSSAVVPLGDVSNLKRVLLLYIANVGLRSCEVSQSAMELDASRTLSIISPCFPACWSQLGHYCRLSQVPFLQPDITDLCVGCSCLCVLPSRRLKNRPCPFAEQLYTRVVDILPDKWSNSPPRPWSTVRHCDTTVQGVWRLIQLSQGSQGP